MDASTLPRRCGTGHEHVVLHRLGHVLVELDDALGVRLGEFLFDEQYDVVHLGDLRSYQSVYLHHAPCPGQNGACSFR